MWHNPSSFAISSKNHVMRVFSLSCSRAAERKEPGHWDAAAALSVDPSRSSSSRSHERPGLAPGPAAGALGGRGPCPASPRPAHQARGVDAGGHGDGRRPGSPSGQGPHHPGPHLPRRRQLRGHRHVRGVRPGGQGDGGARGHRFLHHRRRRLHFVR